VVDTGAQELDLRRYFQALRRRWPVIAVVVGVLVAAATGLSLAQTAVYEGEARVLVQPRTTDAVFDVESGPSLDPELAVETEIQVLKSTTVRSLVRQDLGPVPEVRAGRVGETLMIEVRARSTDPARAAAVANAYARKYIEFRRRQAVDDLLAAGSEVQKKITETQQEISSLQNRLNSSAGDRAALEPRLEALIGQQALFEQRLDELQVQAALKTGGAQLVATASRPTDPVEPTPLRNAVLAVVMGLMLGVSLAAVLEYLDESVKTKSDLEAASGGLPVLGLIPAVPGWGKTGPHPRDLITTGSNLPVAEAYRSLRTAVQLLGVERPLRIIQITSPNSGEGKTTTITNLAVLLANLGQRVVVVDGDMRRAKVHQIYGLGNAIGLSSVLDGSEPLQSAIQAVPGVEHLAAVTAGPVPPNPSELLAAQRTAQVLFSLQSEFDTVLIDSPPVLPVTDATVLAAWVDATVLVATAGQTTVRQVRASVERLRQVDAPIVGTVLNRAQHEASEYGYSYGYAAERPRSAGQSAVASADERLG
jgi:polysaccharide biosynthesis transport protein